MREGLDAVLADPVAPGANRLEEAAAVLLRLVEDLRGADLRLRCALVGVTPPTYRQRVAALGASPLPT